MSETGKKGKLVEYLKIRLEYIEYCNASLEGSIEDDKQQMLDMVNRGKLSQSDPDLGRALFRLEYLVATTFRYCMLAAVCTFLEESMTMLGELVIDDYREKVRRERRGSWLKKQLRVYKSCSEIEFTGITDKIRLFEDMIVVRNAVVHAWGRIDACRGHKKLREVVSRHSWAEETENGYVFLDDQAVPEAMIVSGEIVNCVLAQIPVKE